MPYAISETYGLGTDVFGGLEKKWFQKGFGAGWRFLLFQITISWELERRCRFFL